MRACRQHNHMFTKVVKTEIQGSVGETREAEIQPSSRTASVHFYQPIRNNVSCLQAVCDGRSLLKPVVITNQATVCDQKHQKKVRNTRDRNYST